jgi:hypothetical protein
MNANPILTILRVSIFIVNALRLRRRKEWDMVGLAAALFIGLFAFGQEMIGWSKASNDEVQLALFMTFILGILCGYKTRG